MVKIKFNIIPFPHFKDLVTFIPNKKEPIHNWYYYKECYSRELVEFFIREWNIRRTQLVFDPFCGVGTTLLTCKQNSIPSAGMDASPLAVFTTQVKTADYDLNELQLSVDAARAWKFSKPNRLPKDRFLKRAMSRYALQDIIFYREKIKQIPDVKSRHFLLLALMDAAFKGSYLRKDGSVIKIKKQSKPPVRKLFKNKIYRMLKDLKNVSLYRSPCVSQVGDARHLLEEANTVDYVITSPPYLNKIEYTKIYKFEYSLFFEEPTSMIRGFIGGKPKTTDEICSAYFADMQQSLEELQRICKPGAKLAIVIGGGCFPDRAVLVDEELAKIAEEIGFNVSKILVARNSWCTRKRTEKVGQIRESVIILENV